MSAELVSIPNVEEDLADSLDADLDAAFEAFAATDTADDLTIDVVGGFQIGDQASADWALRKIARAQDRMNEAERTANTQIAAIMAKAEELLAPVREWRAAQLDEQGQTVAFFTQLLNTYHRRLLLDDPKRKSIKLPHGTLSSRQGQRSYAFGPEFIEWAMANAPELVRAEYKPEVLAAKAALELVEHEGEIGAFFDGELVPGVEVTPAETKFSIATDPAKAKAGDAE